MELDTKALEAAIRVEFEGGNTQAVISAYLAALEKLDTEGWIEWKGGECPVDENAIIDVKLRGGVTYSNVDTCVDTWWDWRHDYDLGDIIAYRIHKGE